MPVHETKLIRVCTSFTGLGILICFFFRLRKSLLGIGTTFALLIHETKDSNSVSRQSQQWKIISFQYTNGIESKSGQLPGRNRGKKDRSLCAYIQSDC